MPRIVTKQEMASLVQAFATTHGIIEYRETLYMPVDFLTREPFPTSPERTIWNPLDARALRAIGNYLMNILFASDGDERSFRLMMSQFATQVTKSDQILVRVGTDHVELLNEDGTLGPVTGNFVANYLDVPYQEDNELVRKLFEVIVEWVGSEEQAHSLLYHIATALQPSWPAVKNVLLIGAGRNGKGTLLRMIEALFGRINISSVTRQDMAGRAPTLTALNGKLLNIVFDGPKTYIKDSSAEKTLTAGERLDVKLLYISMHVIVQTNALFIEAFNKEPKAGDKSDALQARLARFAFNKTFKLNRTFEKRMLSQEMLAAFLGLLIEHWVNEDEIADKLSLTAESLDLQLSAVWSVSPLLRFLEAVSVSSPNFLTDLQMEKVTVDAFLVPYRAWMETNGYKTLEDEFLLQQMKEHFVLGRKTFRINNKPSTRRYIRSVSPDTKNAIELLLQGQSLDGENDDLEMLKDEMNRKEI